MSAPRESRYRVLSGEGLAERLGGNPADPAFLPPMPGANVTRLLWSGTLAQELFASHPANWMADGRRAVQSLIERLAIWAHDGPLLVQPHARHLVSDVPSALAFADAVHEVPGVGLAFSPGSLFEESMLHAQEEHLERFFVALGPRASAFLAEDVRPEEGAAKGERRLVAAHPGEGVLSAAVIRRLAAEHLPPGTPVLIAAEADPEIFLPAAVRGGAGPGRSREE